VIAGMDAWKMLISDEERNRIGIADHFGTGTSGIDKFHESIYKLTNSKHED
jgi:hypothetical protein